MQHESLFAFHPALPGLNKFAPSLEMFFLACVFLFNPLHRRIYHKNTCRLWRGKNVLNSMLTVWKNLFDIRSLAYRK